LASHGRRLNDMIARLVWQTKQQNRAHTFSLLFLRHLLLLHLPPLPLPPLLLRLRLLLLLLLLRLAHSIGKLLQTLGAAAKHERASERPQQPPMAKLQPKPNTKLLLCHRRCQPIAQRVSLFKSTFLPARSPALLSPEARGRAEHLVGAERWNRWPQRRTFARCVSHRPTRTTFARLTRAPLNGVGAALGSTWVSRHEFARVALPTAAASGAPLALVLLRHSFTHSPN